MKKYYNLKGILVFGLLIITFLLLGGCTSEKENKKGTDSAASSQSSQVHTKSDQSKGQNAACSIQLVEYKLLNKLKDNPLVSKIKPVLSIRISFTFEFDKESRFVLPLDNIKLVSPNGKNFTPNYLGDFEEKLDEFSMNRLDAYTAPQEITKRTTFNGVVQECSNFIYFPPDNGKGAFLLFDGTMCDRKTQKLHMGFDIDASSGPFSLSLGQITGVGPRQHIDLMQ